MHLLLMQKVLRCSFLFFTLAMRNKENCILPVFVLVRYNEIELLQNCIRRRIMKNATRYAITAAVVVLVLLIVGLILAGIFHVLLDVLYVFLIILAALMITATLLQVYSVVALLRTIFTVRDEMKPLLASVQDTIGIVQDTAKTAGHTVSTIGSTAKLTSEFAVGPSVRVVAAVVAAQQMLRVFLGKGHVLSRAEKRRKQQMEAMAAG